MAVIYENGQVVIPKYLREMFMLKPGTHVQFVVENEELKLKPQNKVLEEFEELRIKTRMNDKEINELIEKTEQKRKKEWLNVP